LVLTFIFFSYQLAVLAAFSRQSRYVSIVQFLVVYYLFVMLTLQNAPAWTNLGLIYLLNNHIEVSYVLSACTVMSASRIISHISHVASSS